MTWRQFTLPALVLSLVGFGVAVASWPSDLAQRDATVLAPTRTPQPSQSAEFQHSEPDLLTIVGTVTGTGGVLAGARVCWTSLRSLGTVQCVETDSDGTYSLRLPNERPLEIGASATAHITQTVSVDEHTGEHVDFGLVSGVGVSVSVADAYGGAVVQARVVALSEGRTRPDVVFTDESGRAWLGLRAGTFQILTEANGYAPQTTNVSVPRDRMLEISLAPTGAVRGRVALSAGDGVENVTLSLRGEAIEFSAIATSGPTGEFEFPTVPVGGFSLVCESENWDCEATGVNVGAGAIVDELEITLAPATVLRGRLMVEGSPCRSGGVVELSGPSSRTVAVDQSGQVYVRGLQPGLYSLALSCPGARTGSSSVRLEKPLQNAEIWELVRGETVSGFVRSRNGTPKAGLLVRVESLDSHVGTSCETTQTGRFECSGLEVGDVTCAIFSGARSLVEVRARAGRSAAEINIVVDGTGALQISGLAAGEVVAIRAQSDATTYFGAVANDGTSRIENVPLGQYHVMRNQNLLEAPVRINYDGEIARLSLPAARSVSHAGRVVNAVGAPLADLWVQAVPQGGLLPMATSRVLTDGNGRFLFEQLPEGQYGFLVEGTPLAVNESGSQRLGFELITR